MGSESQPTQSKKIRIWRKFTLMLSGLLKRVKQWLANSLHRIWLRLYGRKYWANIDEMPIYNWFKWHEEKDNSYLSKTRKIGSLVNYFGDKIMTQFIERFGFSEVFIKTLEKEKELVLLQARRAITDDRSLNAFIKICELEIEALKKETTERADFYEIKGVLEHEMGFQIDIKKVSVAEYYTYFKALKKIRPKQNG